MNPYAGLVRTLGRTSAFAAVARHVLPPLDRAFAGRRRTVSSFGTALPVCYLTARGRLSGVPKTVALLYGRDGDRIVVAESNWGRRTRPAWAVNLDAEPSAAVSIAGVGHAVVARRATDAEAARWWPMLLAVWPGWDGYRRRSGREIALYVLEPAGPA